DRMNNIPKLVASRTLTEPLNWNATLIKGDVAEEIAKLKQEPGKDIEMYGSAALMQTLMEHNLIDEYRIWVHPFVIGGGKRLFTEGGQKSSLQLVGAKRPRRGGGCPAPPPPPPAPPIGRGCPPRGRDERRAAGKFADWTPRQSRPASSKASSPAPSRPPPLVYPPPMKIFSRADRGG